MSWPGTALEALGKEGQGEKWVDGKDGGLQIKHGGRALRGGAAA